MEKSALAGEGGVCFARPTPFSLFTITNKVAVNAPAERADTLPNFISTLCVLCGVYFWLEMFSMYLPNWRMRGGQGGGVYGAL